MSFSASCFFRSASRMFSSVGCSHSGVNELLSNSYTKNEHKISAEGASANRMEWRVRRPSKRVSPCKRLRQCVQARTAEAEGHAALDEDVGAVAQVGALEGELRLTELLGEHPLLQLELVHRHIHLCR